MSITLVCGLLCCAFVFAWVRSHRTTDLIAWGTGGGHDYEIVTIPGQFRFTRVTNGWGARPLRWWASGRIPPWWPVFGQQPVRTAWLPVGVGLEQGSRRVNDPTAGPQAYAPMTVAYQIVAVPFAVPAIVFGLIRGAALRPKASLAAHSRRARFAGALSRLWVRPPRDARAVSGMWACDLNRAARNGSLK